MNKSDLKTWVQDFRPGDLGCQLVLSRKPDRLLNYITHAAQKGCFKGGHPIYVRAIRRIAANAWEVKQSSTSNAVITSGGGGGQGSTVIHRIQMLIYWPIR